MKNKASQILIIFLPLIAIIAFIGIFAGRFISLEIQKKNAIPFVDDGMAKVYSQIFDKEYYQITQNDLDTIEIMQILTYEKTNTITVLFDGYIEASNKPETNREELLSYSREIDITDISIERYDDVAMLTNLVEFHALYTGIEDFSFLNKLGNIRTLNFVANYNCIDYSFASNFPMLEKLTISECTVDDLSFVAGLSNLSFLSLTSITQNEYSLYDISFISELTNLKELDLTSNMIFDITPISSLTQLEELYVGYNSIENVSPIADLVNLKFIDLTFNLVEDISPLTKYNPDGFERIILDLNESIDDWSPLDYLGDRVQGRPSGYIIGS